MARDAPVLTSEAPPHDTQDALHTDGPPATLGAPQYIPPSMLPDDPQLSLLGVPAAADVPAAHDAPGNAPGNAPGGAPGQPRTPGARRAGGLVLVPVAYTPDTGRPICPVCWSGPDIRATRGARSGRASPRGWGVSCAAEPAIVDGRPVPVVATIYRCANPACETALELHALMTGGYVPEDLGARRLTGPDAARYRAGRTTPPAVWLGPDGAPRTARAQHDLFA